MYIDNLTGLDKYGISITSKTEIGAFGAKRTLLVETPIQLRGGNLDIGEIGAFSYLGNSGSLIRHVGKIGRFCAFARDLQMGHAEHSVSMLSAHPMFCSPFDTNWGAAKCLYEDMEIVKENLRESDKSIKRKSYIQIGNDVWIGQGAYISRGVTIGDGAVIAARSVVVKDVPPYTVVGGVPAKPIKQRFSDDIIEKLLALKWWDFGPKILKGIRLYNIEEAINKIEKRIADGAVKYVPQKLEISVSENAIYCISSDKGTKTLIKQY